MHLGFRQLIVVVLCWMTIPHAHAITIRIQPDGNGDFATIQEGINYAGPGDVVALTDGIYVGPGNRDLDLLGKAIALRSYSGDPEACILDCQGSEADPHRGINTISGEGPQTVIQGITIRNGWVSGDGIMNQGGGISCVFASPTLQNLVLEYNTSGGIAGGTGGGMQCRIGSPHISNVVFQSNQAGGETAGGSGGGLYILDASPTLEQVSFLDNKTGGSYGSGYGAGICADSSIVTITDATFSGNRAGGSDYVSGAGGGIYATVSTLAINGTLFDGNWTRDSGGGIYASSCDVTVFSTQFLGNSAGFPSGSGGGMYVTDPMFTYLEGVTFARGYVFEVGAGLSCAGNPTLRNCTFYANDTAFEMAGSAMYFFGEGAPAIEHTIIAFHEMGIPVEGGNPVLSCCDVYGNWAGDYVGSIAGQDGINGNFSLDPLFCDAVNLDLRIDPDSPCAAGECGLVGAWPSGCEPQGDVGPLQEVREYRLYSSSPNPCTLWTTIRYDIPEPGQVNLEVFDSSGRLVQRLVNGFIQEPGVQAAVWDGTDVAGHSVDSGIYFYRLRTAAFDDSRTMLWVK